MIESLKLISDQGNILVSKLITYFGVSVGIGGGAVQAVVNNNETSEFIQTCAEITPDWMAYAPAVAAVSLVVKNLADVYFKRLEAKQKSDE